MRISIENINSGNKTDIYNTKKLKSPNYEIEYVDFYDSWEAKEFLDEVNPKYLKDYLVQLELIKYMPGYISEIDNQTEELQIIAVNKNKSEMNTGNYLEYCNNPTELVILNAIENGCQVSIIYEKINNLTNQMKKLLLQKSYGWVITYFKKEDITQEDEELALELRKGQEYDLFRSYSFTKLTKDTMIYYLNETEAYENDFQKEVIQNMEEQEIQRIFDNLMKDCGNI